MAAVDAQAGGFIWKQRLETGTGFACAKAGVTPALRGPERLRCRRETLVARASLRMTDWKRRLGTGTGFACAKLSEILPLRELRSLRSG